jgi:hypothetical protein
VPFSCHQLPLAVFFAQNTKLLTVGEISKRLD